MRIIAGRFKNRPLIAPKGQSVRPTSGRLREALFNICQPYVEGAKFLDLFAGSGAMGLEALSRGAAEATFVDSSKESVRCIEKNLDLLQVEGKVYCGDVFALLKRLKGPYDIIFADPPYEASGRFGGVEMPFSEQVLLMVDGGGLLNPGGVLFIEDASSSLKTNVPLNTLRLHSARRVGRSELLQYTLQ